MPNSPEQMGGEPEGKKLGFNELSKKEEEIREKLIGTEEEREAERDKSGEYSKESLLQLADKIAEHTDAGGVSSAFRAAVKEYFEGDKEKAKDFAETAYIAVSAIQTASMTGQIPIELFGLVDKAGEFLVDKLDVNPQEHSIMGIVSPSHRKHPEAAKDITPEVTPMLQEAVGHLWFLLCIRNLEFNADGCGLTDDDVCGQLPGVVEMAHKILEVAKDDSTRELAQKIIDLEHKAYPGMFGHVSKEDYPEFCKASDEIAKSIRALYDRYGLSKAISHL